MSSNIFLWFCHTAGRQFTRNWQSHYNSINSSTLPRKAVVICYFALRFFFFLRLGSYFHDNFRPVASSCPPSAAFCRVLMDFRPVVGCCCFFFLFRYLTTMLLARVYSLNSYIAIQSIDLVGHPMLRASVHLVVGFWIINVKQPRDRATSATSARRPRSLPPAHRAHLSTTARDDGIQRP
jgi:hypothetical protein